MADTKQIIKSTQEQAVASWIGYLNQLRLNTLLEELMKCDDNLKKALTELQEIKNFIGNTNHILGNINTKHGEIAEQMQVHISNAKDYINNHQIHYTFDGVGRTAPEDYLKDGHMVQSKFINSPKNTLFHIEEHIKKYPDFVNNGGTYEIPKDYYEKIEEILNKNPSELTRSELNLIKQLEHLKSDYNIDIEKNIAPSSIAYSEAQLGKANETINKAEEEIHKTDEQKRKSAYDNSKPTLQEGAKATAVSAAIEGGLTLLLAIAKKAKEGKHISEFDENDWNDIGIDIGKGALKGGIRGAAVYSLTNFTATNQNVACAFVTAVFGVIQQSKALHNKKINEEEFIDNSLVICLDASVSAISAIVGQLIIPIPILGAIIGTVAGTFFYSIVKENCENSEKECAKQFYNELLAYNKNLDYEIKQYIEKLNKEFAKFSSLLELAFDEDVNNAFANSINLAKYTSVDNKKILKNKNEIDNFFIN